MNIAIITPLSPPDIGGPATYTDEIAKRLSERGHRVKIATLSPSARGPGVYVIRRERLRFPALLYTYLVSLINILKLTKGSDVIYVQSVPLLGIASYLAARVWRKPVALRFAGDGAWEQAFNTQKTDKFLETFLQSPEGGVRTKWLLVLQKFALNRVDKIIVPSQFLRDVLVNYYRVSPARIKMIYNSIDLKDWATPAPEVFLPSGKPRIITIGRLICHKRIDRLIWAIKELARQYPQVSLQVVGDGPEKGNLKELARRLDIEERVEFRGQLAREETMALLRQADIFILNSVYEGFPHTVIEAMACQTPVIATNIRGTNEVVKNGETGLLVAPDNDAELVEKIALLLGDEALRERLATSAYKDVEQRFTWEKNLSLLEKELEATQ